MLCLYYSYIHSYLNYVNTACCSTNRTYLKKLQSQQKHAIRIMFHKNKFAQTQETQSYIFDAYIKPKLFNKNFLEKNLGIILERLTRDLMIRPKRSSASSFPVSTLFYLLPEKVQYCNVIAYFLLFISFLVYFFRVVT